jgi:multidrug resistance efflux pump
VPRENDWVAIERQENILEEQEERAAAQAQEAMARVARLRKQRRFLRHKKVEMARRGLCFLDELDAAEAKESEEREARDREIPAPVSDVLDLPSILGLDDFDPDPAFWETLGFSGGTPQASQGS